MTRERIYLILGGALSIFCCGVLMLCGNALVRTFHVLTWEAGVAGSLDAQIKSLTQDLSLTSMAAAGAGVGLCLLAHALETARRVRGLPVRSRLGIALAGVMIAMAGALLLVTFRELAAGLRAMAETRQAPTAEAVLQLARGGVKRSSSGFFTLVSAQLVLAISLGPVFWDDEGPRRRAVLARPLWGASLAAAAGFAVMLIVGAQAGTATLESFAMAGGVLRPSELAEGLFRVTTYGALAGGCLVLYGVAMAVAGLLFSGD